MTETVAHPDTRPRINYRLPDGSIVKIIHDHGQIPMHAISFTLKGGEIVEAALVLRRVVVRYIKGARDGSLRYPSGNGWSYFVTDAETGRDLSSGWSAGMKADAVDSFNLTAREKGWTI